MYQNPMKKWCCCVCGQESTVKTDISRHVESVHIANHPGYECSYCGSIVKSKNALRMHISRNHKKWINVASHRVAFSLNWVMYCLELSDAIEKEVLSMMYQTPMKIWCCCVCGKEFKTTQDIKRHIESLHITNHPGYVCNYCGINVKSKNALRLHISNKHRQ